MDKLVRAALAGVAIGGFAAAVVGANKIALHALWEFNCLAIETACEMAYGFAAIRKHREAAARARDNAENEV